MVERWLYGQGIAVRIRSIVAIYIQDAEESDDSREEIIMDVQDEYGRQAYCLFFVGEKLNGKEISSDHLRVAFAMIIPLMASDGILIDANRIMREAMREVPKDQGWLLGHPQ
jgi:hypothetical protein